MNLDMFILHPECICTHYEIVAYYNMFTQIHPVLATFPDSNVIFVLLFQFILCNKKKTKS